MTTSSESLDLQDRARRALEDDFLRTAVRFTTDRLKTTRKTATEQLGRWEDWRERGRQIRAHTVSHLDHYLGLFATNARKAGARVHFAADAADAERVVLDIAKQQAAILVAKSKSMVTEEIHLNRHLEEHGIEVVETDLGEYIIQLAGEAPSHIIIPAIHKTREQIRELFAADGAEDLTTDTKALTAYARKRLRETFLQADIGITGCNFAIAESGSVVLFTNEGNGRMVSTLPKTHIVLMGMERIIPTLADLDVMANLLPRSATGQKLTTYMSIVTGPRKLEEQDGPDDLHIVILDNGRSRQLGDPEFQEILHCIRCGACLNVCPVYRHIGGHSYGSVYPGPIGAVLTPLLQEGPEFEELPYASSLCGACHEACPVKIPLHDMLAALRRRQVERGRGTRGERMAFRGFQMAFSNARRYRGTLRMARMAQAVFGIREGRIDAQFGALRGWTATRAAPALADKSFRERYASLEQDVAIGSSASGTVQTSGADGQLTVGKTEVNRDE